MSIESILLDLTSAINGLTKAIESSRVVPDVDVEADATAKTRTRKAKADKVEAPVVEVAPVEMPPAPVFEAPAPTPVVEAAAPVVTPAAPAVTPAAPAVTVPFNDSTGLMEYVMTSYQSLGPEKGASIQGVLIELGVQNVNAVRPDQYEQFYRGVEALKAS